MMALEVFWIDRGLLINLNRRYILSACYLLVGIEIKKMHSLPRGAQARKWAVLEY